MTNGSLMKVENIGISAILLTFISDNRSWKPIFCLFEWLLKTGFTVQQINHENQAPEWHYAFLTADVWG